LLKASLKFVYAPYIIVTMSIVWLLPFARDDRMQKSRAW